MARIQITISAENAQAIAALKQVAGVATQTGDSVKKAGSGVGFDSATKSAGGFLDKLSKVTIVGAGIVAVLREIKDTAAAVLGPGFNFSKNMETNRLGMAGILQSMTLIDGKTVDFNQALAISSDMMKKLQMDALKTAASTEDLVEVFRAILAPGLNAGMTLEQIRQITTVGTNAIKSLGIPRQQIVQELRDLVQGGITAAGSTLATALGITDADIKKAKDSSGGLFKFLMDRMEGFKETSNKFPDTLAGKLDQLNEMWTMANAKFTEKFEEPLKDGLQEIMDLIGTVNTETGEFEVNPNILNFIDDVKSGYREVKELASDIKLLTGDMFDSSTNSAKNLYGAVKDLGSILIDLGRIAVQISIPGMKLFGEELDREIERIKWLTDKAKTLFDYLARLSGAKSQETTANGMADFRQKEDTNVLPSISSTGNITTKFPDVQKAVENSQTALKIALDAIAADAKKAVAKIKSELEKLEVSYKQSMISPEEYARRKTELEMKVQQVAVDEAQRKLEATQSALYDKDSEKKVAVDKANNELAAETEKLKTFGASLDDVNKAIGAMTGASNTWRKEVENVNIDGLQDNAKAAINALSAYFYQQTGRQMVVSSGLRTWESHPKGPGEHISGIKFDVVDAGDSRLLEDNVNGIRDKLIAYAKSLGLKILDAYAGDEGPDAAKHLDFNAKDFTATFAAQAKNRIGQVLTKSGLEYLNSILDLMSEADEIVKSLAESRGDVSSRQKAELTAKYSDLQKKFSNSLLPEDRKKEILSDIDKLQKSEFAKLDFAQAQKDIELANGQLVTNQETLLNELAAGTKTAADITDEYAVQYKAKTDKIIAELQRIAKEAGEGTELSNSAKALLRQIVKSVNDFADAVIQRIDAELQNEIAMINADRSLTNMQRQDKIDAVTRQKAGERAARLESKAQKLRALDLKNNNNDNAATIIDLEQAASLNRELAKTPTLLEKIQQAGKQGLEDGLLDFLERGIIECRNLGDAFRNLAISVLQSIQKVYSEAMTKNIMNALFGNSSGGGQSAKSFTFPSNVSVTKPITGFADGGSMDSGKVTGPGSDTSDSILAWVGNLRKFIRIANGEFVMRGAAVRKYGAAFLERLNSGQVPVGMLHRYALGGALTNRRVADLPGPQDLTANLSNNTTIPVTVVNIKDPDEIPRFLKSRDGGKVILNVAKDNATTLRRILEI